MEIARMRYKLTSMTLVAALFMGWILPAQTPGHTGGQLLGGSLKSPVRIEVYSDFQCAACRELYLNTIRRVIREYSGSDKVCVIYHEFPLAYHAHSRRAALYSLAASRLGQQKLLPVLDALFTDQVRWAQDGNLDASVAKVLPREDFQNLKKMLQDSSLNAALDKELQLAKQKSIKFTPTMFVYHSGKQDKVEGFVPYPVMKQFIDQRVN
jgi:protein-disulfide isomerase